MRFGDRSMATAGKPSTSTSSSASVHPGATTESVGTSGASASHSSPSPSTVDAEEVRKFGSLAKQWWDDDGGPFAGLHQMNLVRVPIIRDAAVAALGLDPHPGTGKPLDGVRILDIGCGGGILSEVSEFSRLFCS